MRPAAHDHLATLETALDFVNTSELVRGLPTDHFRTTADALDWLHEHGLVHDGSTRSGVGEQGSGTAVDRDERTLRRIRRTRAALRELADATYERRSPAGAAIDEVNRVLRSREVLELVPGEDGLVLDHRHIGDPVDDALANLAEPLVREIVGGRPERLRACASETCRWVFYDNSRTGRRRWCDMASCGNRAKAARHRARVKREVD